MKQNHLMTLADELLIEQQEIDNFVLPDDSVHIRPAQDFKQDLFDRLNGTQETGIALPWEKTFGKVKIDPGLLSLWAGYNGHKKSLLTGYVINHFLKEGQTACIASMEMHPAITLKRMAFQGIGNTNPTNQAIDDYFSTLNGLYLYDQLNTIPTERVLKVVGYCGYTLGLDHCVVDSLMKCGMPVDDYSAQKNFVNKLTAIAKDTGMHIHLVVHMRKPPKDVSHVPDKYEIAGGGDITNQADNVFIIWTDVQKKEEAEKPNPDPEIMKRYDILLKVDKQRHGEHEPTFGLYFNNRNLRFEETSMGMGR